MSQRAKLVWGTLLASMTLVGGLLLLLDGKPRGRSDGLDLPPMMAAAGTNNLEAVFNTLKPLEKGRWKSIVIRHSGGPSGNPTTITAENKKRDNNGGLPYHFVIGNGNGGMEDGHLSIGHRWRNQESGLVVNGDKNNWYPDHGISICLVGNGDGQGFSKVQMTRLVELVQALSRELAIPADPEHIALFRSVAPNASDPGRRFDEKWFRAQLAKGN